jgi:serine/threonine protein phosphatase 1
MLLKFLRSRRAAVAAPVAHMPQDVRAYAIGDIHGRLDLLDQLIDAIDADDACRPPAQTHLVFLGDLIDRGPQSAEVIDRVIEIENARPNVSIIAGNHEEVFLLALEGDREALRFFSRIGGRETILSYGIAAETYDQIDYDGLAALLAKHVPAAHIDFLRSLKNTVTLGDYLFVHAGIRPGVALEDQKLSDLRWIRRDFLDFDGHNGFVVVHGHTPSAAVEHRHNRVGIDTGAWETGRLTALGLQGTDRWQIDTAPPMRRAVGL